MAQRKATKSATKKSNKRSSKRSATMTKAKSSGTMASKKKGVVARVGKAVGKALTAVKSSASKAYIVVKKKGRGVLGTIKYYVRGALLTLVTGGLWLGCKVGVLIHSW